MHDSAPLTQTESFAEPSQRYFNRELSWLDFNERVLELVADSSIPLLERVRFLAIFSLNLDQFFQVRVGELQAQREAKLGKRSYDGQTPAEQLHAIGVRVRSLLEQVEHLFTEELVPALRTRDVLFTTYAELGEDDKQQLKRIFEAKIFPVLTPLSVDPAHPFPYISTLSLNLAVIVRDRDLDDGAHRFARVKVPPRLPRFMALPDGRRFLRLEELIAANVGTLFPGMEVLSHCPFRVTRDASLEVDMDVPAGDLVLAIETGLRRRRRTNLVCRLEVDESMSSEVLEPLTSELELEHDDVYTSRVPLDLYALSALYQLDRPELKNERYLPVTQPQLMAAARDKHATGFFDLLRTTDVLVHHPYEAFQTSVQAFLEQAASDPAVLAIKHTLYRTSGPTNAIVHTLNRAAADGKQVVALVELRARFDEAANIEWARMLEEAGVHVVYGVVGLKTHCKTALVVRQEADGIRRYCHIGTGNYNPTTAGSYEDIGIFSADPALCADLSELFNYLTGCSRQAAYRRILVAPESLRSALMQEIHTEAEAPDGEIAIKVNNLADPGIIDALYAASQAGATVDLLVRSICCLRPGVPGLSERIRVRSVLGRFLEHSRVFRFGSEARGRRYYIGSADLMVRNLDERVEVLAPVDDPALRQRLDEVFALGLATADSWHLDAQGEWKRVRTDPAAHAQTRLQKLAKERWAAGAERAKAGP